MPKLLSKWNVVPLVHIGKMDMASALRLTRSGWSIWLLSSGEVIGQAWPMTLASLSRPEEHMEMVWQFLLLLSAIVAVGCATPESKQDVAGSEVIVIKVNRRGLWEVESESCQKEAGDSKVCRSYVYSLELNCLVDLLGLKRPLQNERVIAYQEGARVAEAVSGENGVVDLVFEDQSKGKLNELSLSIRGLYYSVRLATQTELTVTQHFCHK